MKYFNYNILFFFIIFFLFSCNENSFYRESKVEDVWRLPLLEPYELKTALNPSRAENEEKGWGIMFKNKILASNGLKIDGVNVNKINVKDSIIYGYGENYPCYPFIINLKDDTESIFDSKEEWTKQLRYLNIDCNNVSDILPLFEDFRNKNNLPWHSTVPH